ncbi:MAG: hypothetical protein ACTSR8_09230 [Promethearchaeota archaeon]
MEEKENFKVKKPLLIDKRIKTFEPLFERIEIWSDSRFWKIENEEFYSEWFHQEIDRLKAIIIEFVKEGYNNVVCEKYELDYFFLRNLVYWFSKYEDIVKALFKVNGWQGQLGLEIACNKLRFFFDKHKRFPKTKDKGMIRIRNSVLSAENWKDFGITSWDELLIYTFGKERIEEWRKNQEKKKFETAIQELKNSQNIKQRLPKYSDKDTYWISGAISRGIWKKFGIATWNDILKLVFGNTNIEFNIYEGIEGYKKAKEELLDFFDDKKKLPTASDFESITGVISRGTWKKMNINTWNDMLRDTFGRVNLELKNDYTDEESFERVQNLLKVLKKKNGRLPKSTDNGMSSIVNAIRRRMFEEYGILTWNDLIKHVFGKVNRKKYDLNGRKGLEKVIKVIKEYKKNYNKEPSTSEFDVIYRTLKRGEWKELGLLTWDDLLNHIFEENNRDKNKYKGREGLNRAIEELKGFKEKYKKIPTSVDKGIPVIYNIIQSGEWNCFGINSWNDLLMHVFDEIYYDKNKHQGKQGLDKAIETLKVFEKKNKRIPKLRDEGMTTISSAISRGMWKEFGIFTWNDLLDKVFGKINKDINKYSGRSGLEIAIQELENFKKEHKKLPTSNSKGITSIYTAIRRGEWLEYGISTWNDLLNSVFGAIYFEIDKYKGREGLERAIKEMKTYYKKNSKKPTSTTIGFNGIYKFIQKGEWKIFGITSWNDLLMYIFGEIYIEKNKYFGKEGLDRAKQILMDFKKANKKLPIVNSKGMGGLVKAILRGEWKKYEIHSWNDLLYNTFGKINKERYKYIGKEGLDRAIQMLKEFKRINGIKPKSNSMGINEIYNNARNGTWKEFGIESWNDLLRLVFGEIHIELNKYVGKNGLDRAIREIIEYKEKNGKNPTSKTYGFKGIYDNAARRGKWKQFGINSWKDLIKNTFREKEQH